jgi:hypothetical protein
MKAELVAVRSGVAAFKFENRNDFAPVYSKMKTEFAAFRADIIVYFTD